MNDKKIRVLEITGEPILHGGQENFIANLIKNIDDEFSVDVLTLYSCKVDSFRNLVESKSGKVFELHLKFEPGNSRLDVVAPLLKFLKDNYYDVVHIHSGSISVLAYVSVCAKISGVKKIIVHSHSMGYRSFKHSLCKLVMSPLMLIGPTDYAACSKEAGRWKFPSLVMGKLHIIKNGIKIEKFKYNPKVRANLRHQYGISDKDYVIGHIGRFSAEKNHEFLLKMFQGFLKNNNKSILLLVGEGDLRKKIEDMASKEQISDKVVFAGNVDNPEDYYSAMDVFCLPSKYEGAPIVNIEAQANGLIALMSDSIKNIEQALSRERRLPLEKSIWIQELQNCKKSRTEGIGDELARKGYSVQEMARTVMKIYKG